MEDIVDVDGDTRNGRMKKKTLKSWWRSKRKTKDDKFIVNGKANRSNWLVLSRNDQVWNAQKAKKN